MLESIQSFRNTDLQKIYRKFQLSYVNHKIFSVLKLGLPEQGRID